MRESDFVTLHVSLTPETRRRIGAGELEPMKPTAYFINTARGPVVDEKALVEALKKGRIRGAGLDVYEREPVLSSGHAELENVVILPHAESSAIETRTKMAAMAVENLLAGLRDETPPNCINCPSVKGMSD